MQAGESVANKRALQVSYAERSRATIVSLTERRETEGIPPYQLKRKRSVSGANLSPPRRHQIEKYRLRWCFS